MPAPRAAAPAAVGPTGSGGGAEATSGLNTGGLARCPNPLALSSSVSTPPGTKQAAPHPLRQSLQSTIETNSIPTASRRAFLLIEGGELCTTRSQCSEALPAATGATATPRPHRSSTVRWLLQSTTPIRWLPGYTTIAPFSTLTSSRANHTVVLASGRNGQPSPSWWCAGLPSFENPKGVAV